MLNSIKIQNYRNLKHLSVEKLGRVNLIIGKNNTGKTSFLEALFLFTNHNEIEVIQNIIKNRGENHLMDSIGADSEKTLQIINNLFWSRNEVNTEQIDINAGGKCLSISIKYIPTPDEVLRGRFPGKHYLIEIDKSEFITPRKIFLNNTVGDLEFSEPEMSGNSDPKNVRFVRSNLINETNSNQLAAYLDNISLGDNYKDVIDALQIVDKDIDRIAYLTDSNLNKRFPVARLKNGKRVSLLSMGDGINRILAIILTMVNCENGYLLIDEFENGLHYSVQEKLWEIIFYLSEKLKTQVFVTTHSNDTIRAFENIVNQNESNPLNGLLIKLENINDNIESLVFEPAELKVITEHLIEVRR